MLLNLSALIHAFRPLRLDILVMQLWNLLAPWLLNIFRDRNIQNLK